MLLPGRLIAKRLSADLICDGQTVSKNATREQKRWFGAKLFMANGVFKLELLRLHKSEKVSRKVVLEAHDIPRHRSGDLPKNRFWSLEK